MPVGRTGNTRVVADNVKHSGEDVPSQVEKGGVSQGVSRVLSTDPASGPKSLNTHDSFSVPRKIAEDFKILSKCVICPDGLTYNGATTNAPAPNARSHGR